MNAVCMMGAIVSLMNVALILLTFDHQLLPVNTFENWMARWICFDVLAASFLFPISQLSCSLLCIPHYLFCLVRAARLCESLLFVAVTRWTLALWWSVLSNFQHLNGALFFDSHMEQPESQCHNCCLHFGWFYFPLLTNQTQGKAAVLLYHLK